VSSLLRENFREYLAMHFSHFKVESVQKSKDFIVVSGFAESPGFKPLVFDPGDS
jgi:hypothetical protein